MLNISILYKYIQAEWFLGLQEIRKEYRRFEGGFCSRAIRYSGLKIEDCGSQIISGPEARAPLILIQRGLFGLRRPDFPGD